MGVLNKWHCRFPARLAAPQALQLLCLHNPHYADVVFQEDGLADLSPSGGFRPPARSVRFNKCMVLFLSGLRRTQLYQGVRSRYMRF